MQNLQTSEKVAIISEKSNTHTTKTNTNTKRQKVTQKGIQLQLNKQTD